MAAEDNWVHRAAGMQCRTCMWFVRKKVSIPMIGLDPVELAALPNTEPLPTETVEVETTLGRCRKHAPSVNDGWPAVFQSDWCGDHKLDERTVPHAS